MTNLESGRLTPEQILLRFTGGLGLSADTIKPVVNMLDRNPDDFEIPLVYRFQSGERIVVQREPGDSMYFISFGTAEVKRRTFDFAPFEHVGFLGPGDVFGEIAVIKGKPRTADVVAYTDTVEAYRLHRDGWIRLQAFYPGVVGRIMDIAETRELALAK